MDITEFSDARVIKHGNNLHVVHGDDNGLFVEFKMEAIQDEEKSVEEGRPIFKEVPFVSIRPLGDKTTHILRPVKAEDKIRFARQWQAFENSQSQEVLEGTPVTEWAVLTKAQALELKALNIHTVEKLAEVSDANLNFAKGMELRKKAQEWLEAAKDKGAAVAQWDKREAELLNKVATLEAQIESITQGLAMNKAAEEANERTGGSKPSGNSKKAIK